MRDDVTLKADIRKKIEDAMMLTLKLEEGFISQRR